MNRLEIEAAETEIPEDERHELFLVKYDDDKYRIFAGNSTEQVQNALKVEGAKCKVVGKGHIAVNQKSKKITVNITFILKKDPGPINSRNDLEKRMIQLENMGQCPEFRELLQDYAGSLGCRLGQVTYTAEGPLTFLTRWKYIWNIIRYRGYLDKPMEKWGE